MSAAGQGEEKTPTPEIRDGYTLCTGDCPVIAEGWQTVKTPAEICTIGELGEVVQGGTCNQCYRCEWRG